MTTFPDAKTYFDKAVELAKAKAKAKASLPTLIQAVETARADEIKLRYEIGWTWEELADIRANEVEALAQLDEACAGLAQPGETYDAARRRLAPSVFAPKPKDMNAR